MVTYDDGGTHIYFLNDFFSTQKFTSFLMIFYELLLSFVACHLIHICNRDICVKQISSHQTLKKDTDCF